MMLLQRSSANMLSLFYKKGRCRLLVPKTNRSVCIMRKIHNRLEKVISANYIQRKYKRTRSFNILKRFAQNSKNPEMTTRFDNIIDETRVETVSGQDIKAEEANIIKLEADSITTVNTCGLDVLKHKTKHASFITTMLKLFHNKQRVDLDTTTNQTSRKEGRRLKERIPLLIKEKDVIVEGNGKEKLQDANSVKSQDTGKLINISKTETFKDNLKDEASFQDFTCVNGGTSGAAPSQTSVYPENSKNEEFGNDAYEDGQAGEAGARSSDWTIFRKTCSLLFKKSSLMYDSTTTSSRCTLKLKQNGSSTCTNENIIALRTLQKHFNKKCDVERQCNGDYDDDNNYDRNTKVRATTEVSGIIYNESNTSSVSEQSTTNQPTTTNGTTSTSTYYLSFNSVEFINERKAKDDNKKKEAETSDTVTETTLKSLHDVSYVADDWWSPMLDDRKEGCHQSISYNPIKLRFAAKRLVSFKSVPTIIDVEVEADVIQLCVM